MFLLAAALTAGCGAVDASDGGSDAVADRSSSADGARDSGDEDALAAREDSAATEDAADDSGPATMDARADSGARDSGADSGARDSGADSGAGDGGLMLTGLPTCPTATVTAAQLYTSVVSVTCAGSRCHDPGSMGALAMQSAVQMRNNLRMASRTAALPRVTPGDVHRSYVMYKLLGQQARVSGGMGSRMPPMVALSNTQLCLFVNWIRGGAM